MWISSFKEDIKTECSVADNPILNIKALKLDANKDSLKQKLFCKNLKSCDYFKRKKDTIYFVELSDFNAQLERLSNISTPKDAKKYINMEVRLKISDTLLIYYKLLDKYNISDRNYLKKKFLLAICLDNIRDIQNIDRILRGLESHYCPTHLSSIKIIPYTQLNTIFKR